LPQLSFKHQVSFIDHRTIDAQVLRGPERGIVQVQAADGAGNPTGDWIKLYPYVNAYDTQANSNFFNCTFDPTDDGNTEEDFFDPSDPQRFHGPSSACAPEFNFADQGLTSDDLTYGSPEGDAEGPALQGEHGEGWWVEPQFDLSRWRGRSLRLRLLQTGLKLGNVIHYEQIFVFNPDTRDDGWWIDDVVVSDTLVEPATLVADTKDNGALPDCSIGCSTVDPRVAVTPERLDQPGAAVRLDAAAASADRCRQGVLEWAFWLDADANGTLDESIDVPLRGWSQNPLYADAPRGSVTYLVAVRCASEPECAALAAIPLEVACPTRPGGPIATSGVTLPFLAAEPPERRQIVFADAGTLAWPVAATVDVLRGDLGPLRQTASFMGTAAVCLLDDGVGASSVFDGGQPLPGEAWYYLARSADSCNQQAGGSYGTTSRDSFAADPCPPAARD
jgi:hypothetical protein